MVDVGVGVKVDVGCWVGVRGCVLLVRVGLGEGTQAAKRTDIMHRTDRRVRTVESTFL